MLIFVLTFNFSTFLFNLKNKKKIIFQQTAVLIRLGQCKNIEKHQRLIVLIIPNLTRQKTNKKRHTREVTRIKQFKYRAGGPWEEIPNAGHKNKTHIEED